MTIKKGVDLGASFERLKAAFKRATDETDHMTGYAILYANTERFINTFSDPETIQDIPGDLYLSPGLSKQLDDNEPDKIL